MRRAENEEYRQRQSMGLTGVRIGRMFQAEIPDYKKGDAVDRGDTLLNCVPWPKLVQPVPDPWKGQKNKTKNDETSSQGRLQGCQITSWGSDHH